VNPLLDTRAQRVAAGGSHLNIITPACRPSLSGPGTFEVHGVRLRRPRFAIAGHGQDLVIAGEGRNRVVLYGCHATGARSGAAERLVAGILSEYFHRRKVAPPMLIRRRSPTPHLPAARCAHGLTRATSHTIASKHKRS